MPFQQSGYPTSDRTKASLKMNAFLSFFLAYTFLRSISNGLDHAYNINFFSPILSVTAIVIGLVAVWHMRHVRVHRRLFTLLMYLSVFLVACGLSFVVNASEGKIIDQYAAWYAIFRYVYLMMFVMLLSSVYRHPAFCLNVHRVYVLLLFLISAVGLVQHITGHTELLTQYDKFKRVTGLSSHPVPFSLEIVLTFCVCELSRRKLRLPIGRLDTIVYMLFLVALVFSASRTGVVLLGATVGIFLLTRRPSALPAFAAAFAVLIWTSPFGELFSDLSSVPEYILKGEYVAWDWQTAVTSFHWRIHHWYYLSTLALERPWIGFGPGQVTLYSPFSLSAHSQFVEIFFETGLLGLISFSLAWFSIPLVVRSDRQRLVMLNGKHSAEIGILHLWIAMFAGVTLVALFDQSFNQETVSFSHLIVSMFVVLAQPQAVAERAFGSRYSHVTMTSGSPIEALRGGEELSEPQPGH
jgi:O-antigen ligase